MEICAFDRSELGCSALNVKKCEKCSFYKTHDNLIAGREKARNRIKRLPKGQQEYIYTTYYGNPYQSKQCLEDGE